MAAVLPSSTSAVSDFGDVGCNKEDFSVEAKEVPRVGKQIGVSFSIHEPEILCRIEALEAWAGAHGGKKNTEPILIQRGRPRSLAYEGRRCRGICCFFL